MLFGTVRYSKAINLTWVLIDPKSLFFKRRAFRLALFEVQTPRGWRGTTVLSTPFCNGVLIFFNHSEQWRPHYAGKIVGEDEIKVALAQGP